MLFSFTVLLKVRQYPKCENDVFLVLTSRKSASHYSSHSIIHTCIHKVPKDPSTQTGGPGRGTTNN